MSKPEYWPVVASWKPRPGWSLRTPMITRPRCCMAAKVGEPSTVTPAAAVCVTPELSAPGLPSRPQPVRARALTSSPAARWRSFMKSLLSVGEDLAEEVLGPVGPRLGEELVRGGVLDDLAA